MGSVYAYTLLFQTIMNIEPFDLANELSGKFPAENNKSFPGCRRFRGRAKKIMKTVDSWLTGRYFFDLNVAVEKGLQ
jgi:hypothetical protein